MEIKTTDLILEVQERSLSCCVPDVFVENIIIVAFGLFLEHCCLQEIYTDKPSITFDINKSGRYKIRFYYKTSVGQSKNLGINSSDIEYTLISPESSVINEKIFIYPDRNKITVDISDAYGLYYKVISCTLVNDSDEIIYVDNENKQKYSLYSKENGRYTVSITYEKIDGTIDCFSQSVDFIKEELASSQIDKNLTIKLNKNYRLLFNIIYAFVVREFQRKYDKGYFRYFSVILGPLVQIGIMVAIFSLMGTKAILGLSIPLFVLTGLVPYNFFTSAGNSLTIVQSNRNLLTYKQVKIIDTIFASILMEFLLTCLIFAGGLVLCWYFGMHFKIYNLLSLIAAFILLFVSTFGLAMILSVVGFYFNEFNYAIQVIFRALFYVSGVFFSVSNVPVQYQKYFLWNPLFQFIQFIRYSLVSYEVPHALSYIYVMKVTLACFTLGLMMYFVNRNIFMINDRARV